MNLTKIRNLAGVALLASLAACSGTGSCPPNGSNGELSLKIEAPAQYPAGLPESINAVLTMTNTSTIDANNLKYTVPAPGEAGNYTGVTIIPNAGIDSAAESCINIKAGASCTFTATIGAYANPGSFTVTATPNSSKSSVKQALNKLLGTNSISVTANLGLVDIPDFPSYFYILPDMQTITSNSNGSTTVMLSLLVKDAPENLDNIVLVDGEESSIVLDAKPVVTPSYTVNSVNTYQVTIPAGTDIQKVRAIGYANNVPQCTFRVPTGLGYYAICSNTATINLVGTGTGILSVQPTYVNMNESYESQVITITNIGTGNATNIVYPTISAPFSIENNTCGTKLAANTSCTFKIIYTAGTSSGESDFVVSYNNGVETTETKVTINYAEASTSLKWSQEFVKYTVLSESSVSLTYSGGAPFPVVSFSEPSGLLVLATSTGSHSDVNKCDFQYGNQCTITIKSGNVGDYVVTASSSNSLSVPNLAVTITPIFNYVADYGSSWGNIWMCQITQESGDIDAGTCQITNGGLDSQTLQFSPISMVFATSLAGEKIAYALSTSYYGGSNGLYSCSVNSLTGLLENCQDITNSLGFVPSDLYSMGMFNNILYITDYGNGNIYQCPFNASTGQLGTCVQPDNNAGVLTSAKSDGIAFYTNSSGTNYVLFAGYRGRDIYTCQIAADNSLQGCSADGNSNFNNLGVGPTGIAIAFGKAYVADWSGGGVYICDITEQANLENCAQSPKFTTGKPEQLTIQGNVLFIADGYQNQAIWKCIINPLDGSIVSDCEQTPPSGTYPTGTWYPGQIIFNPYQM